jgi:dTDP-glucose pyrophosphorylase
MRSFGPRTRLADLHAALAEAPDVLAIVDESGAILGIVGDRELRNAAFAELAESSSAAAVMDAEAPVVRTATAAEDLRRLLDGTSASAVVELNEAGELVALHDRRSLLLDRARAREAVLMVGGKGQRLRPLTAETPKPLLPVGGKPILEHIVASLVEHGVEIVTLALGYRAEQIVEHFGDGENFGLQIRYVREETPLGTAGAIGMVEAPREGPLLVMNGDLLTELDLSAMALAHDRRRAAVTMAARPYQHQVPFGVLRVVGGRIVDIREKPTKTWWTNAGVYLMDPEIVGQIESDRYLDMTMLVEHLIGAGREVASFPVLESWCDIGQPADYERANRELS